jgi:CubicO group peptidase (beta-lactamase class C family)
MEMCFLYPITANLSLFCEPRVLGGTVPGRYGWDGGMGTSWYADPKEEMITLLMTQCLWTSPRPPNVCLDFWTSAYQAIDD